MSGSGSLAGASGATAIAYALNGSAKLEAGLVRVPQRVQAVGFRVRQHCTPQQMKFAARGQAGIGLACHASEGCQWQ